MLPKPISRRSPTRKMTPKPFKIQLTQEVMRLDSIFGRNLNFKIILRNADVSLN